MSEETEQEVEFSDGERSKEQLASALRKPMTTTPTETPRMNAAANRGGNQVFNLADEGQRLEQELAAMTRENQELKHNMELFSVLQDDYRKQIIKRDKALADKATLVEALKGVLSSANPRENEHPSMFHFWKQAKEALRKVGAMP